MNVVRIGLGYPNDQAMSILLPRFAKYKHDYQVPHVGELQAGFSTTTATCTESASGT